MNEPTLWWVLAGSVIAVEMMTGTFYLLMLSMGFVAAAIAAHAGLAISGQLAVAAVVAGGSVLLGRRYRKKITAGLDGDLDGDNKTNINAVENLDVGATVHVDRWQPDGTSSVKYRGANWEASLAEGHASVPGLYRIVKVVGSRLILAPAASSQPNQQE